MPSTRTEENRRTEIRFSIRMREVLIAHLDGIPVPVPLMKKQLPGRTRASKRAIPNSWVANTTYQLINRDLLTYHPTRLGFTVITDKGRRTLAELLADYVEALARVGAMDGVPFEITKILGGIKRIPRNSNSPNAIRSRRWRERKAAAAGIPPDPAPGPVRSDPVWADVLADR